MADHFWKMLIKLIQLHTYSKWKCLSQVHHSHLDVSSSRYLGALHISRVVHSKSRGGKFQQNCLELETNHFSCSPYQFDGHVPQTKVGHMCHPGETDTVKWALKLTRVTLETHASSTQCSLPILVAVECQQTAFPHPPRMWCWEQRNNLSLPFHN